MNKYIKIGFAAAALSTAVPAFADEEIEEEGAVGWIATLEGGNEISLIIDMKNDNIPLQNGSYDAELVLESTTPISFLWN